ncbi:type I phosphomannose isomerase catalytic subunit [Mycoplasma sp. (ex Biomphalaria glabrata)]|uniref:type I phosphomannose isomerase catalytic subunit n=1 Tax=Mycoplasma sp. (ex Biomphalaria glabrata) TaxID=1749074 RepID=UPI000A1171FB|nr:type I phosphomannose isomerase catalytic subunit [Mycoplasma sp. (ex Biomphalaria glabrata)]
MIKIMPYIVEKPWGGTILRDKLKLPTTSEQVGELWITSAIDGFESICQGHKNVINKKKLSLVWEKYPNLFGNYPSEQFPFLIKLLDVCEDLSVQVHPNDQKAQLLENEQNGKNEAWYILSCAKNSKLILGTNAKNREELAIALSNQKLEQKLVYVPIKHGNCFFIEAGTVHALLKPCTVYEIQQTSTITYRLYDFDRLFDGIPRELHVNKSLECVKFDHVAKKSRATKLSGGVKQIFDTPYFSLFELTNTLDKPKKIPLLSNYFLVITNISESAAIINGIQLAPGETCIITKDSLKNTKIESKCKLLIAAPANPVVSK